MVAVALVVAETLVVYPLRRVPPEISLEEVAAVLCSIAALARSRSIAADERRGEADLARAKARLLLRNGQPARALGASAAAIELEAVAGEERRAAFPLRGGRTLPVRAEPPQTTERLARERVVASVQALFRAGRDGEGMGSASER